MLFPELCTIKKLLRFPLVYCSFRVVTLGTGIHWKGRVLNNTAWSAAAIITYVWSQTTWGSHSTKKCSTCSVMKLGKQISCAIYCTSFSEKNGLVFSNDEWSILKVSLVGFDNARSGHWGYLQHHRPVRKYAFLSMSFMTSAASLKSKIRNANSAFSGLY